MTRRAILIPIDNRPVTYVFPRMIAEVAGVDVLLPPRQMMGSLKSNTSPEALSAWLVQQVKESSPDAILVCADSIVYGGLIPSRRSTATVSELLAHCKLFGKLKKGTKAHASVMVQSSIMRISDNYDNTEEKEYWSRFGRELFAWSAALHMRSGTFMRGLDSSEIERLEARIDPAIRLDYLQTRQRNFQVNRRLLDFAETGDIDWLVFSQDDSGRFGLNVKEKDMLLAQAKQRGLHNVTAYPGADEVLMSLIARWLLSVSPRQPQAAVTFSPADGGKAASLYEGQSIAASVSKQLTAAGLNPHDTTAGADLHFVIHTSGKQQGDHIWLPGHADRRLLDTNEAAMNTIELIAGSPAPVVLCDVAFANGADPLLIEPLLKRRDLWKKIWGYAGWNTTGNTLGSAIALGVARFHAGETGGAAGGERADRALKDALFVRLADDWAYQTQVRKHLRQPVSQTELSSLMEPYLAKISEALAYRPAQVELGFPWDRTFEVEVSVAQQADRSAIMR